MDPEQLVQCPYDKSHQIRAARLPYHLVKCEKNNPGVARRLATCPFNARHRVPRAAFQHHIASCPDRRQLDLPLGMEPSLDSTTVSEETPPAWQGPPCQEDWEAELQGLEEQPPFILRVGANDLRFPSHCSAPTNQSRDAGGNHRTQGAGGTSDSGSRTRTAPDAARGSGGPRCQGGCAPLAAAGGHSHPTGFK